MIMEEPLPKIRQAVFIVDKSRLYKFDVNQTITIGKLKKMIIAAANLSKNGIRIFHSGTEYTDKDDLTLDELFPSMQLVEFTLSLVMKSEEEMESYIKIKFKQYCAQHQFKYPYFYCYDCHKSICSQCVQSLGHNGHNFIEKYDYLQSSRNLVEQIFIDLKEVLAGAKSDSEETVEILRQKISVHFFPQLVDMVKILENKLIGLIEFFFEHERANFKNITGNVSLLKNHCAEGLDKLKSEIAIEDMMLDEEIFLTFDRKFKDIAQEKKKVHSDMKKYEEVREQLKYITASVETIYNDIYSMLEKYITSSVFNEIQAKVQENTIEIVRKDDIFMRLLSDIKKGGKKNIWGNLAKTISPFPNLEEKNNRRESTVQKEQLPSPKPTPPTQSKKQVAIPVPIPEDVPKPKVSGANSGVQMKSTTTVREMPLMIGHIVENSKEIILYNHVTGKVTRQALEFLPLHGVPNFLAKCAWINTPGKIYISGGLLNNNPSQVFLVYDIYSESLKRLADMKTERHLHSCFYSGDFIYAVGGKTNTTEKYDMKDGKWVSMGNLNTERQHPVLWVHNGYLFAFFGENSTGMLSSVEKINLMSAKAKWEIVATKAKGVNLMMYGCGIVPAGAEEIIILGGKAGEGLRDSAITFNFATWTFEEADCTLENKAYFQESQLINLGNETYGHFNLDENNYFMKIQFGN